MRMMVYCLQVRTHCGHVSDLFPPPVVFPATREVMEGYKNVSPATSDKNHQFIRLPAIFCIWTYYSCFCWRHSAVPFKAQHSSVLCGRGYLNRIAPLLAVTYCIFQYGTATGSCGTISWQIEGLQLRSDIGDTLDRSGTL